MHSHKHEHSHSHDHSHGHKHHHHHHGAGARMGTAFFLNLFFAIVELIGGLYTNSLAILSDAFHDLGDAFAIGIAWFLEKKSLKGKSQEFSYGYRRLSVMAALITGLVLMLGSGLIVAKAIPRLFNPETPDVNGMLWLAVLGLTVNGIAAFRMSKGESLNERMILWHLLEDVLGWAVILIGSIVMYFKPIPILDPIMALGVAFWVLWNVFHNLKETMRVFLQATPDNVNMANVETALKEDPSVQSVHHTHLWTMDGTHHILTTHLIVKSGTSVDEIHMLKARAKKKLFTLFHISEATIEIEWPDQQCYDPEH